MIAGDTELGVRLVSILLALPMSWAVYQAAAVLFGGRRVAATAAILLNVTLMAAVGTMIVTPDAPLLVASSFVLFSLAKVLETGRGAWWLAVGLAVGAALLSKYTALFFGPAILIWLIAVPKLRRWLISPWLYLGGLVALAMFSPVILWNADHHWVSFIKQMGRAQDRGFQAGLHRRTDPDADRVRDAAGVDPRRDGALRAVPAPRRRAGRARAGQHDVLDHRRLFHLAFAACPRRGELVRAGLSGVRGRGRRRRPSRAMGRRARSARPISACAGRRRPAS